jgi:hypothetical protein
MVRREGRERRRVSPLLGLLVREEVTVFLVVVALQIVLTVFTMTASIRMYTGAVFQYATIFTFALHPADIVIRWFITALAICVSP